MMKCEYCNRYHFGDFPSALQAGWGYLRFQFNKNGRIIEYCPDHQDQAFTEMLSCTRKVLVDRSSEHLSDPPAPSTNGGSHA